MPPQLLSRVKPGAQIILSASGFAERPKVAQGIAQCISNWSLVEAQTGRLFLSLLGANPTLGTAVYNEFGSSKAKTDAIRTLAISSLSNDDRELVFALLKLIKSGQKTRDKIAHWVWGFSPDIKDAMILVDTKTIIIRYATLIEYHGKATGIVNMLTPSFDIDEIYLYTESAISGDANDFHNISELIANIRLVVSEKHSLRSSQLRAELRENAHLAGFLCQLQSRGR